MQAFPSGCPMQTCLHRISSGFYRGFSESKGIALGLPRGLSEEQTSSCLEERPLLKTFPPKSPITYRSKVVDDFRKAIIPPFPALLPYDKRVLLLLLPTPSGRWSSTTLRRRMRGRWRAPPKSGQTRSSLSATTLLSCPHQSSMRSSASRQAPAPPIPGCSPASPPGHMSRGLAIIIIVTTSAF